MKNIAQRKRHSPMPCPDEPVSQAVIYSEGPIHLYRNCFHSLNHLHDPFLSPVRQAHKLLDYAGLLGDIPRQIVHLVPFLHESACCQFILVNSNYWTFRGRRQCFCFLHWEPKWREPMLARYQCRAWLWSYTIGISCVWNDMNNFSHETYFP